MVNQFGFINKDKLDPIDFVDTVNVFFLGPNAAIKETNRKKAGKQFRRELKTFRFEF